MPSFRKLSPASPLRKLRTTFSPSSSPTRGAKRSESGTSSSCSTSQRSLSPSPAPRSASISPALSSHPFSGSSLYELSNTSGPTMLSPEYCCSDRAIRRKKSVVELELEIERFEFDALVGLVEPRPKVGPAPEAIEAVLHGQ